MRSSSSIPILLFFPWPAALLRGKKGTAAELPQDVTAGRGLAGGRVPLPGRPLRAAPGRLLDLIELLKEERDLMETWRATSAIG